MIPMIQDAPGQTLSPRLVRAAFETAERDGLAPLAALVDMSPSLDGGAAAVCDRETEMA
jgi:hypothetical protein